MVNPGGTGNPACVISARPAPLPPNNCFASPFPSSNGYTHLLLAACDIAFSVPPCLGPSQLGRATNWEILNYEFEFRITEVTVFQDGATRELNHARHGRMVNKEKSAADSRGLNADQN